MTPCIRYRAWLACTGRVEVPTNPSGPYEWAYVRESTLLYSKWVHQMWCNYNRKPMPELAFSGFSHPQFDSWLQRIYLPSQTPAQ